MTGGFAPLRTCFDEQTKVLFDVVSRGLFVFAPRVVSRGQLLNSYASIPPPTTPCALRSTASQPHLHIQKANPPPPLHYPYTIPPTLSAIAKQLVNPGLSMPSRFTHPLYPSSSRTTKSTNPLPPATPPPRASFGRIPA